VWSHHTRLPEWRLVTQIPWASTEANDLRAATETLTVVATLIEMPQRKRALALYTQADGDAFGLEWTQVISG
jgi:hypothetical protein